VNSTELTARARRGIVGLLAAVLLINFVDRGAVPTAAPMIQDELGLSVRELGLLFSAFFWSYSLLQIPLGWVAERVGVHRVLAAGICIWACATMLVGLVHSFAILLALRLLLGLGESAGFPCVSKLLASVVPVKDLATANGIITCLYLLGPAVGTYCGGLLIVHYGWRAQFFVFGGLSLLWLLPWSQVRLPKQVVQTQVDQGPTLSEILKQRSLWGTALGLFSTNYSFYVMLTWLPYYVMRERGFSTADMASIAGMAYAVNALSALIAGFVIDRFVRSGHANFAYKSVMVVAHLGTVVCMVCIAVAAKPWALAAIFFYEVLSGASSTGCFAISQILAGPTASARWVGVQNACGNFAGVIAPALTGLLVEETHHFTGAFVLAGSMSVLGVVGWVLMVPNLAPIPWRRLKGSTLPTAGATPLH